MHLLMRFDEALVRALDHDAVVDEINPTVDQLSAAVETCPGRTLYAESA